MRWALFIQTVNDLAQANVDLVQRIATGGIGDKALFNGFRNSLIGFSELLFSRIG